MIAALWLSVDYYSSGLALHVALKILGEAYIHAINFSAHADWLLATSRKKTVSQSAAAGVAADAMVASPRELRLRVYAGSVIAMGPGKADLLSAIQATGSISAAARELGMSYKRCWDLVSIMNEHFKAPLVISVKGGPSGGGAELSAFGAEVLKRYRTVEERAAKAIAKDVERIRSMLRE